MIDLRRLQHYENYLAKCREINKKVSASVEKATGVRPRTKVKGFGADTFSVDISTGEISVIEVPEPDGFLIHENGHRSAFPASTAGFMAFTSAIHVFCGGRCRADSVRTAANVVIDVVSDYMIARLADNETAQKLIQRLDVLKELCRGTQSPSTVYKLLVLEALREKFFPSSGKRHGDAVAEAKKHLQGVAQLSPYIEREVEKLVYETLGAFHSFHSMSTLTEMKQMIKYMLSPNKDRLLGDASSFLQTMANIAGRLAMLEEIAGGDVGGCDRNKSGGRGDQSCGGADRGGSGENHRQETGKTSSGEQREKAGSGQPNREQGTEGTSSGEQREKTGGGKHGEKRDPEAGDVEISNVTYEDIQNALSIMRWGFGIDMGAGGAAIEAVFSDSLAVAVRKLLEKMISVFSHSSTTIASTWFTKEQTDLWLHPSGDPDEDSMLKEKHKLLWRVEVKRPVARPGAMASLVSAPEHLVLVIDESGSTYQKFADTDASVLSVEAFIASLVYSGLRHRGGAKKVKVIKFSDDVELTYDGSDPIEVGKKIILPFNGAGRGTDLVTAVKLALWQAKNRSAMVVVTDLVVPTNMAEHVGEILKSAVDSGKLDFLVFVIVGGDDSANEAVEVLNKIVKGQRVIISRVKSAGDLVKLGNNIVATITNSYA